MSTHPASAGTSPLSSHQLLVFSLCFVLILIDGFDTQAVAFAGPALRQQFGAETLGLIFGAGLLGGLVGGVTFGTLGDRFGRRPLLLISLLIIALGSLATALASTPLQVAAIRFVTGLGLGGAIPNVLAVTAEYAPTERRSTIVAIVFSGFPLGAVVGSILSSYVVPEWGWRALFVIGGAVPALCLPVVMRWLPESLQFLSRRGRVDELRAHVERVGPMAHALLSDEKQHDTAAKSGSVKQLFSADLAGPTTLIWLTYFVSLLCTYCLINWLPTLAADSGLALHTAILAIASLNIGSVIGNVILGRLADRTDSFAFTGVAYVVGAFCIGAIGLATGSSAQMLLVSFAAGLFYVGAQLSVTALIPRIYPSSIRATGLGWSFGVGRLGGVAGPVVAGFLIGAGLDFAQLMALLAALAAFAGGTVLLLGQVERRRRERAAKNETNPSVVNLNGRHA
jgi:MFS transporter, AAHS family, 4-hydroxybenzoate transporter